MRKPLITESLVINGETIKREATTKFVGVIVDDIFHGLLTQHTLNRKLLKVLVLNITLSTLRTLYNAFVYPYFNYAIGVWGRGYL